MSITWWEVLSIAFRQALSHQRLERIPEPEPIMYGEDRCQAYAETADNQNLLAIYDFCADVIAGWGLRAARVVDIGCGTGSLIFAMAELFPDYRFTGIDASPEMLDICRKRAKLLNLEARAFFEQGEMLDLALPDGFCEIAACTMAAHHAATREDVSSVLRTMLRITGNGGVLILDLGRLKTIKLNREYVGCVSKDYSPEVREDYRQSMAAAFTAGEFAGIAASSGLPGLRHWATFAVPTLQILVNAPPRARREGPRKIVKPARSPKISRDYRSLRALFGLSGYRPDRV